jgi:glycosyltransferase involved in cell wall biosynthesis
MPRVLIIAHHFPPAGTGGVGRALGWARHLPAVGWDVTILAATPAPNWPLDQALTQQIPDTVAIYHVPSADYRPASLRGMGHRELSFLWYRPALVALRSIVKQDRPDVILATSPPPTSLRLAARVGKEFGIRWVADFRDPWTVRAPGPWRSWRRRIHASQAAAVTAVNPTLTAHLEQSLKRDVITIYNGFEPDEIPNGVQRVPRRAVYLGTLPKLGTMAAFFKALSQADGEFLHIGHPSPNLAAFAQAQGLTSVQTAGYLQRTDALRLAATGSVFITALEVGLDLTLPTKVFDYVGLGGPILHLGSHWAMADFLSEHDLGEAVSATSPVTIATALDRIWSGPTPYSDELKSHFERKRQAERTAALLQDVLKSRTG